MTGLLRGVLASPAELAIVTMADWLGAGSEARMNTPGKPTGNWQWRAGARDLTPALAHTIRALCARYFRAEPLPPAREPKRAQKPAAQKSAAPAKKEPAAKSAARPRRTAAKTAKKPEPAAK